MQIMEYRNQAKDALKGNWGKVIGSFIVLGIIEFLVTLIFNKLGNVGGLVSTVLSVPLGFGLKKAFLKLYDGEEIGCFEFIALGFEKFDRSWEIWVGILLRMIVPSLILVGCMFVGGAISVASPILGCGMIFVAYIWVMVKVLAYQLTFFIAIDNPELSGYECTQKSEVLMEGRKIEYILLQLSIYVWAIVMVLAIVIFCATSLDSLVNLGDVIKAILIVGGLGVILYVFVGAILTPFAQMATVAMYKSCETDNSSGVHKLRNIK